MYKKKKRAVTLVEMMIVMFLIAMIIGVVAYNYAGSLDEGKAFKTKTSIEKVQTILTLAASEHDIETVVSRWKEFLASSPLVSNASSLERDGWGKELQVKEEDEQIVVTSQKLAEYARKHPGTFFHNEH